MQVKRKEVLLWYLGSVILAPIVFLGASKLLAKPIEIYVYSKVSVVQALSVILTGDVILVMAIILGPIRKKHIKVVLILLILTLSASVLVDLLVIDALSALI
jgi:hypothetical protein